MEPKHVMTPMDRADAPGDCMCFECDAPANTQWRDHTFTYGVDTDAAELIVTLPVRVCSACGFEFLDHEAETLKHEAVCAHLGVLTPREIRGIRQLHAMSRAAFSKLTRLGEATLNRWENGILVQNQANDRYLRLLATPDNVRRLERLDPGRRVFPETDASRFPSLELSDELRVQQRRFRLISDSGVRVA